MLRASGSMEPIRYRVITELDFNEMLSAVTPKRNWEEFLEGGDSDWAYEIPNVARYRVNLFRQQRGAGAVFRLIPSKIMTLEQLSLPDQLRRIAALPSGLVLVTRPTGPANPTTLAPTIA